MTPAQEQQSREIFFEGIGHFEAGRLPQARECFERCLALTPDRPSVLGNLGITLFHLGLRREALPYLQQARPATPNSPTRGPASGWPTKRTATGRGPSRR